MKLLSRLEKTKTFWTLFSLSLLFFLLRFPSLYEPLWYGDEGIYEVIGRGLINGRLLYRDIWDNKPPLLYLFYAVVHGEQFGIRLLSIFFGIGTIIAIYFLARLLFQSRRVAIIPTILFVLFFGSPIIEGNIANAENFMILTSVIAGYFIFSYVTKPQNENRWMLWLGSLCAGLSLLYKVFGLFDFAAFSIFFFLSRYKSFTKEHVVTIMRELLPAVGLFMLPLIISGLYFLTHNAFGYFYESILSGNISYVGWKNDFFIPQGLLIFKASILGIVSIGLFFKRRLFKSSELFLFLWTMFSLFSAFLSQRPYTHYQLVVLPALVLCSGLIVINKFLVRRLLTVALVSMTLILLFFNFYHWDFVKTLAYYNNFLLFARGQKGITDYQSFFDKNTPRDYLIADYVRLHTKPNDTIFVWGNNPEVYVLSNTLPPGRYAAEYHIMTNKNTVNETAKALRQNPPKYIIIMPDLPSIPFDMQNYRYEKSINGTEVYERTL